MAFFYKTVDSPIGRLKLVARDQRLAAILWEHERDGRVRLGPMTEAPDNAALVETARQLEEYFRGERSHFDLELDFAGTAFQRKVWAALLTIPFGQTRSYGEIAEQIGHAKAARAVGAANGRNPIAIIAPCHRVIGASGDLTGFAGGLHAKQTLLSIEGHDAKPAKRPGAYPYREQMAAPVSRSDLFGAVAEPAHAATR